MAAPCDSSTVSAQCAARRSVRGATATPPRAVLPPHHAAVLPPHHAAVLPPHHVPCCHPTTCRAATPPRAELPPHHVPCCHPTTCRAATPPRASVTRAAPSAHPSQFAWLRRTSPLRPTPSKNSSRGRNTDLAVTLPSRPTTGAPTILPPPQMQATAPHSAAPHSVWSAVDCRLPAPHLQRSRVSLPTRVHAAAVLPSMGGVWRWPVGGKSPPPAARVGLLEPLGKRLPFASSATD